MALPARSSRLPTLLAIIGLVGLVRTVSGAPCGQQGDWIIPGEGRATAVNPTELLEDLARRQVVLLGEQHDSAEDHRWQLDTLARLHARQPRMAIALEMLPRRLQPVLDRWLEGGLTESAFVAQTEWRQVWGFDPEPYMPLFHFARMHRVPLLAVNVERSLVDAVGRQGWDSVPEARREGVDRPAAPSPAYLEELRLVFAHHSESAGEPLAFDRFAQAQTLWDRAMAQGMADYLKAHGDALVVGILGAGHVRQGHGVAHQLKALGITKVAGLVTRDVGDGCAGLTAGLADAVYLVRPPAANPPRLGIAMDREEDGVVISVVMPGSVAEQAGLRAGDRLLEIAGRPVKAMEDVRGAVRRQAPGSWLPVRVLRDGQAQERVARFPPEP